MQEIWRGKDILRALRVTPLIRQGKELHLAETKETTEAREQEEPKKEEPKKEKTGGDGS